MRVLKFGGTSLATPDRLREVVRIVLDSAHRERAVVVVSAFEGVTDLLLDLARRAEGGDASHAAGYKELRARHRSALDALFLERPPRSVARPVDAMLDELGEVLHGIHLLRDCSRHSLDLVASFGERLSAATLAGLLRRSHPATAVDARSLIVADDDAEPAAVLFEETERAVRARLRKIDREAGSGRKPIPVITGFIASTPRGRTVTLGRNGSDYTAAIVGAAAKASRIEIWTDVDGVMSADPRAVPEAFVLPELTYEEAMEMSYFGAGVLHTAALAPAMARGIPIHIKNTFAPDRPGTKISAGAPGAAEVAKGISSIDGVTLLTLRGPGMVGVPGTAERMFRALAAARVNVILISQASSEHTVCFAVAGGQAERARRAIGDAFRLELRQEHLTLDVSPEQTVVAVVGEGMKGTPGVAGKVFGALGRHHVNVSAIAQGASERNISFVTDTGDKTRALKVIHQAFFEKRKRLQLFVMGTGNVGRELVQQIRTQRAVLLGRGLDLRVCGVANSRQYLLSEFGIDLEGWEDDLAASRERLDLRELPRIIDGLGFTNVALVDCTASAAVVRAYPDFVRADMHVITPNKLANVLPWRRYRALLDLLETRQKHFLYEANVGAGMPVISTLGDLIASGDTIRRIEGIFSGTLSYLFNRFTGVEPFSGLVREAHDLGYTEPDPREDLSGQDVARKLLIFARLLGRKMDLRGIRVENLVPARLRRGPVGADFYDRLGDAVDGKLRRSVEAARSKAFVLRYVGSLTAKEAFAGLQQFPADHPFAAIRGSDNVIAFTTDRYSRTPLVLQGPGAGAQVTAMGVFSDILKLASYLPY